MKFKVTVTIGLAVAAGYMFTSSAMAKSVDLTTVGAVGNANGATFVQIDPQSTGTGVIDPFVRIQNKGTEEGFNASVRPVMPDVLTDPNFTHDLLLGDVPVVNLGGVDNYQFLLDINEPNARNQRSLSLHEIEIYLSASALASASSYSDLAGLTKAWDLDMGPDGDSVVELDYSLNHGSGSGDMFLYVPVGVLGVDGSQFVTLYSAFGDANTSADGFEEWAVLKEPGNNVPDASSAMMLLGLALFGLEGLRRKFKN